MNNLSLLQNNGRHYSLHALKGLMRFQTTYQGSSILFNLVRPQDQQMHAVLNVKPKHKYTNYINLIISAHISN